MSNITDRYEDKLAFTESYLEKLLLEVVTAHEYLDKEGRPECASNTADLANSIQAALYHIGVAIRICNPGNPRKKGKG